ncbi:putative transcription factor AS2-LOB family [Medicago truncatula]|uniref:LOB domain protein n=2 Tax=Medicago truncatula TaxID=3880 RepID=A0A072UGP3_MEDTR|nr:LOB domain protein [Medicago truncatula]RHN49995.1 putative transcription factor AS2-LOB family [Medicago truncatula]
MNIIKPNKACAACKYQRRKCTRECVLAPYFPADEPKMFGNAHRLFGVSNIQKILNEIKDGGQRDEAMKSIIVESKIRANFPIHGCLGVIHMYAGMINKSSKELDQLKWLLAYCKQNNHLQQQNLYSSIPSTSFQVFNNYGDVGNYYQNSENNMMIPSSSYVSQTTPHDVNNSPIDTNLNINSMDTRGAKLSGDSNLGGDNVKLELDNNEDLDDFDIQIRTIFDWEETEGLLDTDELPSSDFNIDMNGPTL